MPPHLVLAICIEAMKIALSSGCPVVALLARGTADNSWTIESMPTRGILHTYVLLVATSGISHQVQSNPLAALG